MIGEREFRTSGLWMLGVATSIAAIGLGSVLMLPGGMWQLFGFAVMIGIGVAITERTVIRFDEQNISAKFGLHRVRTMAWLDVTSIAYRMGQRSPYADFLLRDAGGSMRTAVRVRIRSLSNAQRKEFLEAVKELAPQATRGIWDVFGVTP